MGTNATGLGEAGQAVARNVRALRESKGFTQSDVSARLGAIGRPLLPTGVLKVEQGTRRVDADDLVALAQVLDVSPDQLLSPLDGQRAHRFRQAVERAQVAVRALHAAAQQVQHALTDAADNTDTAADVDTLADLLDEWSVAPVAPTLPDLLSDRGVDIAPAGAPVVDPEGREVWRLWDPDASPAEVREKGST